MSTRYTHTNIIAKDWRKLVHFYEEVFDCVFVPPQRDQSGDWLSKGTGVENAALQGMHLRLPGFGDNGPTLEIFSYSQVEEKLPPVANRLGFGHLAFSVDNVQQRLEQVIKHGGSTVGQVVEKEVPGVGTLTFVYATDPEDNIVEIQNWS